MKLISFNQDGFDAERIVSWNNDEKQGQLTVWLDGQDSPRRLPLKEQQAKDLLVWLKANSTSFKVAVAEPPAQE